MSHASSPRSFAATEFAAGRRGGHAAQGQIAGQPRISPDSSSEPAVRLAEPGDLAALHRLYSQRHIVRNTGAYADCLAMARLRGPLREGSP